MDDSWTLPELVKHAETSLSALPEPKNGQIRAVPDERTIRYYGTIGLLDRPIAMRGRTALYGRRHLAQVVAIKRLQGAGRSLAEIQALWPTLDELTLGRMSGVQLGRRSHGREFWKRDPDLRAVQVAVGKPTVGVIAPVAPPVAPVELRVELAPNVALVIALADDDASIDPTAVRALRAAATELIAELARRGLTEAKET